MLPPLGDIRRDPSCLIFGKKLGGGLSPRLVLEVDVGKLLSGAVLHDKALPSEPIHIAPYCRQRI